MRIPEATTRRVVEGFTARVHTGGFALNYRASTRTGYEHCACLAGPTVPVIYWDDTKKLESSTSTLQKRLSPPAWRSHLAPMIRRMEENGLTPGDLNSLSPHALGIHGAYAALAAIALHHPSPNFPPAQQALHELAAHSDDPEAFVWVWALISDPQKGEGRWAVVIDALPDSVSIPSDHETRVREFVVHAEGIYGQNGFRAQHLLLTRLEQSLGQEFARELFAKEGEPPTGELEVATLTILCGSQDLGDRSAAFDQIRRMPDTERFRALRYFTTPYKQGELAKFADLVIDTIPSGLRQPNAASLGEVAQLLSSFTPKTMARVLTDAEWPANTRKQVMVHGLIALLDQSDRLSQLLDKDIPEDMAAEVFDTAAATLQPARALDLAETFHGSYPSPPLKALRRTILDRFGDPKESRADLVQSYVRIVASAQDNDPADELGAILQLGELGFTTELRIADTNWHQIGRTAGLAINRDGDFHSEAEKVATKLEKRPNLHADLMTGVADTLTDLQELPRSLKRHFALRLEDVKTFVTEGRGDVAMAGAEAIKQLDNSSRAVVDVICLAATDLEDDDLEILANLVSWFEDEQYGRYVECVGAVPGMFVAEVDKAVASLVDTEANRIPTPQLKALMSAALDSGVKESLGQDALNWMLFHPDTEVVDLAAQWIDQSGDTSEQTVLMVLKAFHETSGQVETLATLRSELGRRLTDDAQDVTLPTSDRCSALLLAAKAHPPTAREAAFELASAEDMQLRAASAEVLAGTPAEANDETRITALIEREKVSSILESFERARRRLTSSNVDEAISQLLQLLEIDDESMSHLDPDVLLPDDGWHDGFINDINDLRYTNRMPEAPRSFINVACSLAETMAEQALVARNDVNEKATSLSGGQADAIRKNEPNKPKVGALIKQTLHQDTFPWLSPLISLRQFRSAHTAPGGTTEPRKLGEKEYRKTLGYLEDVVRGWIQSMYDTKEMS